MLPETYLVRRGVVAPSTANVELVFDPVPDGYALRVDRVRIQDETSTPTAIALVVRLGVSDYELARLASSTGFPSTQPITPFLVPAGGRVVCRVLTPASGDAIWAVLCGELLR